MSFASPTTYSRKPLRSCDPYYILNHLLLLTDELDRFYKEEKAGEKHNYIHNRAFYEGGDAFATLKAAIREVVESHRRIQTILQGKESHLQAWNNHIMGYIAFHTSSARYNLSDLGLGEKYIDLSGNMISLRQDE